MITQPESRAPDPLEVEAIVGSVLGTGGSRFAVAYPRTAQSGLPLNTSITFPLTDWGGTAEPRKGQVVVLESIQKFARGWRALRAQPIPLSQQSASRKEQGESHE